MSFEIGPLFSKKPISVQAQEIAAASSKDVTDSCRSIQINRPGESCSHIPEREAQKAKQKLAAACQKQKIDSATCAPLLNQVEQQVMRVDVSKQEANGKAVTARDAYMAQQRAKEKYHLK